MSGDSENEFGAAGDAPARDSADSNVADAPVIQPRPFRSWTSALEEENKPSLWSRMRDRMATLISRRKRMDPLAGPAEDPAASEEVPLVPTNEYPTETADETVIQLDAVEESAPAARPWFDAQPPKVELRFASMEDAFPASAEPSPDDAFASFAPFEPAAEALVAPKPGLFARLFGQRAKSKPRPSLEIEIHEDRIAAAANALEDVGDQTFAEDQQEPSSSIDAFASVEEALPGEDRFAPPADAGEAREAEAEPDIEIIAADSRDTIEVPRDDLKDADASSYFGDTLEVIGDKPHATDAAAFFGDTIEIIPVDRDNADSEAYFGDTLEPGHFSGATEIEEDTDEYEVVTAPPPASTLAIAAPLIPGLDEDTAQVSRKSLIERLIFWRANANAGADALEGGATLVEVTPVFLFSKFRTFYNEIIRSKHQKTEFTAGFSTAIVTDYTADLSPDGAAGSLSENLAAMLALQAAEATWKGGESAQRYPDAQYAMAALADEIFLHSEWEGQGAWHKNLLEFRLFKTHAADVELFRRIDTLLKDQPNSAVARDLARVYLFVIAAGFQGKYRPFGLTRALAEYRQRLYEYIHQGGDALLIYAHDRRIFPEAAQNTLEGEAVARFTGAQRWAAILVFLLVGYTLVAHVAWSRVSADLRDVTDRIIAGSTTGTQ